MVRTKWLALALLGAAAAATMWGFQLISELQVTMSPVTVGSISAE
jgi:hypothetical protein